MIESEVYLDGRSLSEFGLFLRPGHEHPIPETRDTTIEIPHMNGLRYITSTVGPRIINLPVGIIPQLNKTDLQKKIREFTAFLLNEYGKPREIKLSFGYEPEKYYKVRYSGSITPERLITMGVFELPFIAYDPFAYAPADYYDPDFIPSYDTSIEYDSGVEYKNQTSTPFNNIRQYAGIFNYSHYATPFSFVIEGYVKNPKITNLTSGKSAQLNITVEADERLYFDSKLMTTWKVKATEDKYFWLTPYQIMKHEAEWAKINKYNDMSGDFLELVSGKNSILFEGENPNAYVNFHWEHRFL